MALSPLTAFAEMTDYSEFTVTVDEHIYPIPYEVKAKVIAMAIDPQSKSLLIGLEDTYDSIFTLDLPHELISAEKNEFVILVNGYDTAYELISDSDGTTFSFFVPDFTEEVEIIGTHVIPEFPIGVVLIFGVLVTVVILFSRTRIALKL